MFKIIKESENEVFIKECKRDFNKFVNNLIEDGENKLETREVQRILKFANITPNSGIYEICSETDLPEDLKNFVDEIIEEEGEELDVNLDYWQFRGIYKTEFGNIFVIGSGWDGYYMNEKTFLKIIRSFDNFEGPECFDSYE